MRRTMSEARIRHGHRDVNSDKSEAEAQIRISRCDVQGGPVAYVASRLKARLRRGETDDHLWLQRSFP